MDEAKKIPVQTVPEPDELAKFEAEVLGQMPDAAKAAGLWEPPLRLNLCDQRLPASVWGYFSLAGSDWVYLFNRGKMVEVRTRASYADFTNDPLVEV